ncbi:MAG: hypothetical protein WCH58_02645 [Candidatus Saccharibacteria bacterium]
MTNKYLLVGRKLIQRISQSTSVIYLKNNKKTISIATIFAFFIFAGYYLINHTEIMQNILGIGYLNSFLLLIFYGGVLLTNFGIMYATILLCRKKLSIKNSLLLTIYSSLINFFGPLQSGPAVRAVYLKSKIGLRIRDYTYAMLFYYFAFAALNISLLFINTLPWLTIIGIILAIFMTIIGINKFRLQSLKKYVLYIFALTTIQILLMTVIYSIELNAVNHLANYNIMQTIVYTASANLSLFVSLTPGAIGFREAFLVISGSLHNIPLNSIIASGVIDRAIYILFLIILFFVSSGLHLKQVFIRKQQS